MDSRGWTGLVDILYAKSDEVVDPSYTYFCGCYPILAGGLHDMSDDMNEGFVLSVLTRGIMRWFRARVVDSIVYRRGNFHVPQDNVIQKRISKPTLLDLDNLHGAQEIMSLLL